MAPVILKWYSIGKFAIIYIVVESKAEWKLTLRKGINRDTALISSKMEKMRGYVTISWKNI